MDEFRKADRFTKFLTILIVLGAVWVVQDLARGAFTVSRCHTAYDQASAGHLAGYQDYESYRQDHCPGT